MKDDAVARQPGVVYIAFAKLYFMVAGYAIYFTLPRLLGESAAWGNYLIVVGLVSVIDNVIVTSTIQGVSKFTARGDASADAIKRAAIRIQSLLGGGVALVYFLLAPAIAGWERDPSLSGMYRHLGRHRALLLLLCDLRRVAQWPTALRSSGHARRAVCDDSRPRHPWLRRAGLGSCRGDRRVRWSRGSDPPRRGYLGRPSRAPRSRLIAVSSGASWRSCSSTPSRSI
jgi:hypothetical protein